MDVSEASYIQLLYPYADLKTRGVCLRKQSGPRFMVESQITSRH